MHYPSRKAVSSRGIVASRSNSAAQFFADLRDNFSFARNAVRNATFVAALAAILVVILCAPASYGQANVTGTWQTLPTQMPINPVHTALMSNGKILVVSGSGNYPQQTTFNVGVWDPSTNYITTQHTSWDMFCNGMVALPDGRPFLMGGNLQYDPVRRLEAHRSLRSRHRQIYRHGRHGPRPLVSHQHSSGRWTRHGLFRLG